MSKIGIIKKKWGYDPSTPRCSECIHFRETYVRLTTNSQTKRVNQHCHIGGFTVGRNGLCDKWTGRDGTKLEAS